MASRAVALWLAALLFTALAPLTALGRPIDSGCFATPYAFTTLAGSPPGPGSADGPGNTARFDHPEGVAVDGSGNIYVADNYNHSIRKITPTGTVTTLAGSAGASGFADGTGSDARFYFPEGVAVDGSGNVYVADSDNNSIRKITPAGMVTTFAGSPGASGSGDGTGSAARFDEPSGVAVDGSGNVYVADYWNFTIRKITPDGTVMTLAGSARASGSDDGTGSAARFNAPTGVAVDGSGNVYVADSGNCTIRKITSGGAVTTVAGLAGAGGSDDGMGSSARFDYPEGVAVDGSGDLYVADSENSTIRKVASDGTVTTLAGSAGISGARDGTGSAGQFYYPGGVAVDGSGNVFVADTWNNSIRKITTAAVVTTLAGQTSIGSVDGTGNAARFNEPWGVAADRPGNIYVADAGNHTIRKITSNGTVSTLAGSAGASGSDDGMGSAARFNFPEDVAVDGSGNVYVADSGNDLIRKITSDGTVSTLAGSAGASGSADGMGSAARFYSPQGVAVDGSGNVYVADSRNFTIRKITADGTVSTLAGSAGVSGFADGTGTAARFSSPEGVAVDGSGNVYVGDILNGIRRITPAGQVTTLSASLSLGWYGEILYMWADGVAVDGSGNVFVADGINDVIWKVPPSGSASLIAGAGQPDPGCQPGSADGTGPGAQFSWPTGVAVDGAGNVYVADTYNNTIRKGVPAMLVVGQPLTSQTVTGGSNASFTFAVNSGGGVLKYQWQVSTDGGGSWTDLADAGVYSGTESGTLTITNVTPAMGNSQYRCVASNGVSPDVTSRTALLSVRLPDLAFLQVLFQDVLGREIDPDAANTYGAALAAGRTQSDVLGDLLGSAEYSLRQIEPVIRLYHAAFGRSPDFAGLRNWSDALRAGALTLTGAADDFAESAEFQLRYGTLDSTQYVQLLYQNALGREADLAGQKSWVAQLNAGASRGAVLVGFSESDEFKHRMAGDVEIERLYFLLFQRMPTATELQSWQGFLLGYDQTDSLYAQSSYYGATDASYVQLVFQGFLRREADPGALSAYTDALGAGAITHASLVELLLNSAEFNLNVAPVARLYLGALQRVPDAPGLDNWVNYLRAGNSLQSMADAFVASQEFSASYGALGNRDYVTLLYQNVLGRGADQAGLDHWTALLDSGGATRAQVLIGFTESQEAVNWLAPTVRTLMHYFTFFDTSLYLYPTQEDLDNWNNYLTTLPEQMRAEMLLNPEFTTGS